MSVDPLAYQHAKGAYEAQPSVLSEMPTVIE